MSKVKSPVKYIKEGNARKLPIVKCFITNEWETSRNASVIVIREHVTGNLTIGFYLVDLLCVGVKNTFYLFNEPPLKFQEKLGAIQANSTECSYDMAHNMVWASVDFAAEFGIEPVKEFEVTKYILEEDDENIPLIDIETGENGKPLLFLVPNDPRKQYYINCLDKALGVGNYHYAFGIDE